MATEASSLARPSGSPLSNSVRHLSIRRHENKVPTDEIRELIAGSHGRLAQYDAIALDPL